MCVVCKQQKDASEYNWKNKKLGVRKNYCKVCDRQIKKRYYERHREKVIAENVARNSAKRDAFRAWKETLRCCMCDESDECCLDFHHLDPSQKDHAISALLTNMSFEKMALEISKCICVCSNCHRKIHKYNIDVTKYAGKVLVVTRQSSKL